MRLILGSTTMGLLVVFLLLNSGCGGSNSSRSPDSFMESVPADYRPFLDNGQQVKTNDATLDYWIGLNMQLHLINQSTTGLHRTSLLKTHANAIRKRSVDDVDPEVVQWANLVAGCLESEEFILTQSDDPTLRKMNQEDPALARQMEAVIAEWKTNCQAVRTNGAQLRDKLSQRQNRPFPPCLFQQNQR